MGGTFTSPLKDDGTAFLFNQRSLENAIDTFDFYFEIEILVDLPFNSQNAEVIPWFNQPGLGKQAMFKIPIDEDTGFPKTWNKLAAEGLIRITFIDSPSGNFTDLIGSVIEQ